MTSEEPLSDQNIVVKSSNEEQASYWNTFRGRLIPQKTVRKLRGGISNMTVFRHVKKKLIPPPIVIDGRNYWTLGEILDSIAQDMARRDPHSLVNPQDGKTDKSTVADNINSSDGFEDKSASVALIKFAQGVVS